jgi:hypothetical protein
MLNLSQFKKQLQSASSPLWLRAAVGIQNDSQLYLISPGGQGNLLCAPIECYLPEIKVYMVASGELIKAPDEEKHLSCGYIVALGYFAILAVILRQQKPLLSASHTGSFAILFCFKINFLDSKNKIYSYY